MLGIFDVETKFAPDYILETMVPADHPLSPRKTGRVDHVFQLNAEESIFEREEFEEPERPSRKIEITFQDAES